MAKFAPHILLATTVVVASLATSAQAQEVKFNIRAGSLKSVLEDFRRQSRRPIIYKVDDVRNLQSPGYFGRATPDVALKAILANSPLGINLNETGAIAIVPIAGAKLTPVSAATSAEDAPVAREVDDGAATPPAAESSMAMSEPGSDIVVTAQKRGQMLSDVPISVTAQTGKQLVDKGVYDVQDLVKITPGLSFVDSGRGVPVFSLRGVGFFDQAVGGRPTVSVYLDEAPLPFSIQAKGASFDLARAEVLKGPQGTLFGQSSTGGAINYIAEKPTKEFRAGLTASYGRFNMADLQGFLSGPLSDTLNARIAMRTQFSDDWQRSYTRNDTLGSRNFTQGRFLLDWSPADSVKFELNVNGFVDKSDMQAPQFIGPRRNSSRIPLIVRYPLSPAKARTADWDPGVDFRADNKFHQFILRGSFEPSPDVTITSLSTYSKLKVYQLSDGDGTAVTNYTSQVFGQTESFSQELRASGDIGPLTYLVGGSYSRDRTYEQADVIIPYSTTALDPSYPAPLDYLASLVRQKFRTYAAFADGTFHVADRVRLTAGIRYNKQDLDYNGCLRAITQNSAQAYTAVVNRFRATSGLAPIAALTPGQCISLDKNVLPSLATGTFKEDNVSWRAVVDFKPTPQTLLYASVSKGFKGGSSPATTASSTLQLQPVKQESVLAYEAGVKSSVLDHSVDLSAAAFYYDYKDKQLLGRNVFNPDIFGAISALVNIPKSRIYGTEAQVTVRPVKGMMVSAAATYLDTRVQGDFVNYDIIGTRVNLRDESFPYTPKWQLVFEGENRFPVSKSLNGVFGWNANYRMSTTSGFGRDPRLKIDSYWLLDVRAGIEDADRHWSAQIYGRNILNEYYWSNVSVATDAIRRFAGMPATYGVQVNYNF